MNIGNGIFALLNADTNITNLVGSRIYPMRRSQSLPQVPCIVYRFISRVPYPTKQTVSSVDAVRMEVNIYGEFDDCQTIAQYVRQCLDNNINLNSASIYFQSIIYDGQFDDDQGEYTKGENTDLISLNRTVQEYILRVVQ